MRGTRLILLAVLAGCASPPNEQGADDGTATTDIAATDTPSEDLGAIVGQDAHNPEDSASPRGGCTTDSDCKHLEDGNACNGTLYCDHATSACTLLANSRVTCDTSKDTVCAQNTCNPASGDCAMKPAPNNTPCVDADPCSVDSWCETGACKAGQESWCQCAENADCAAFDDGDPCNGTLYCAKVPFPPACRLLPNSAVQCSTANDTPCIATGCDPKTGKCAKAPLADGALCDDGSSCTNAGACKAGECVAVDAQVCACQKTSDCASKEDGDYCNGTLYCKIGTDGSGTCVVNPATTVVCPSLNNTECAANSCQPAVGTCGMKAINPGGACDDGNACTEGDHCVKGACVLSKDTCACAKDADCDDDGNLCNGTAFCNKASSLCEVDESAAITCPSADDTTCLKNACTPKTAACKLTEVGRIKAFKTASGERFEVLPATAATVTGVPCSDGDKCTSGDVCGAGKCASGSTNICACKADSDCAGQEDGNLCNGTLFCKNTECVVNPATVKKCADGVVQQCATFTCDPASGKCVYQPKQQGLQCDDGNKCTAPDFCSGAKCVGGEVICACQTSPDCAAQDDGNPCNGTMYCDKSGKEPACKVSAASVVLCPKTADTTCSQAQCDPASGKCVMSPAKDGTSCADGSKCLVDTSCEAGVCTSKKAKLCDDGNGCTDDACDASQGCVHVAKKLACDDGNTCRVGTCDPKTGGCQWEVQTQHGKPCNADNSGCTIGDKCALGTCKAGGEAVCPGEVGPCTQPTCQSKDAANFTCVAATKPDGAPCDDGQASGCTLGGQCKAGKCEAGALKRLWRHVETGSSGSAVHITAAAASGDTVIAAGRRSLSKDGAVSSAWWRVVARGPGGVEACTADEAMAKDAGAPVAVIPVAGQALVIGNFGPKNMGFLRTKGCKLATATGSKTTLPGSGGNEQATAAARWDEDVALLGYTEGTTAKMGAPVLRRMTTGGLVTVQTSIKTGAWLPLALARGGDGGWLVVGQRKKTDGTARSVVSVSAQGAFGGVVEIGATGQGAVFAAVVAGPSGYVAAGSGPDSTGTLVGYVSRLNDDGAVLWDRPMPLGVTIGALAARVGGGWALAGARSSATTGKDLWMGLVDADGNPHKQQLRYGPGDATYTARIAQKDGFFAVGHESLPTTGALITSGFVARLDAWGHRSCEEAGACVLKAPVDCDDGLPCTADACSGVAGKCSHQAAEGFTCTSGGCAKQAACAKGVCVPTGDEQLWRKQAGSGFVPGPITAMLDAGKDGLLVMAPVQTTQGPKSYLGRVSVTSKWTTIYTVGTYSALHIDRAANGDIFYPSHATDNYGHPKVQRLKAGANGHVWGGQVRNKNGGSCNVLGKRPRALGVWTMADETVGVLLTAESDATTKHHGVAWGRMHASNGGAIYIQCYEPASGKSELPTWATVRKDGAATILGRLDTHLGATQRGTVVRRVDNVGKTSWRAEYRTGEWPHSAALGDDHLLVGWRLAANGTTLLPSVSRIDNQGRLRWQRELQTTGAAQLVGIVPRSDRLVVVAAVTLGFKQLGRVMVLSPTGEKLSERDLEEGPLLQPRVMTASADGLLWLSGRFTPPKSGTVPFMARLDPWGHDSCAASGKCFGEAVALCNDGDACTVGLCSGKGCAAKPFTCDDDNPCTTDACTKTAGCTHAPTNAACDDGDLCTESDACKGGFCAGSAKSCDDGNPCTDDSCIASKGCVSTAKKDGTSCPVTNGCSDTASCKAGKCVQSDAGKLEVFQTDVYPDHVVRFVLADGEHTALIVDNKPRTHTGFFTIVADKVQSQVTSGKFHWSPVTAAAVLQPGAITAIRQDQGRSEVLVKPHLGSMKLTKHIGVLSGHWTYIYGIAPHADGTIATAGFRHEAKDTTPSAQVGRLQADGTPIWLQTVAAGGEKTALYRALVGDNHTTFAAGKAERGTEAANGLLVAMDSAGKLLWRRDVAGPTARSFNGGYQAGPAQYGAVGSVHMPSGAVAPWLVGFTAAGTIKWQRAVPQPISTVPHGVRATSDGGALLVGRSIVGPQEKVWVQRTDALGNPTVRREVLVGTTWTLGDRGLSPTADGGAILAGNAVISGKKRIATLRIDPWGHDSCKAAGDCAAKTAGALAPKGCNDDNPCSIDVCDADKGCVHQPAKCDDNNPCTADSCGVGKGCSHTPAPGACDDGDVCTLDESCGGGACKAKSMKACDDNNPCTVDGCLPTKGCWHVKENGTPCDDGSKCTLLATCKQGTCDFSAGGTLFARGYDVSIDNAEAPGVEALLPWSDGQVVVAHPLGPEKETVKKLARIGRVDALGTPLRLDGKTVPVDSQWQRFQLGLSHNTKGPGAVVALRRLVNGTLLVARHETWNYPWRYEGSLTWYLGSLTGQILNSRVYPGAKKSSEYLEDVQLADVQPLVDGSLALVASRRVRATNVWDTLLIRTHGSGIEKWRATSGRPGGGHDQARASVAHKDGHVVIAGETWVNAGKHSALLTRLDNGSDDGTKAAKVVWRRDNGAAGKASGYRHIVAVASGYYTAGWHEEASGDLRYLVAFQDQTGVLKWRKHPKLAFEAHAQAFGVSSHGTLLVAGDRADGIIRKVWASHLSVQGAPLWLREHKIGDSTWVSGGLLTTADGGALIGLGATYKGRKNPALLRINAWGDSSCADAGQCRTTSVDGCTKSCKGKLASCDPKSGCVCK